MDGPAASNVPTYTYIYACFMLAPIKLVAMKTLSGGNHWSHVAWWNCIQWLVFLNKPSFITRHSMMVLCVCERRQGKPGQWSRRFVGITGWLYSSSTSLTRSGFGCHVRFLALPILVPWWFFLVFFLLIWVLRPQITLGSPLWDQVRPHPIKRIGGKFYPNPPEPTEPGSEPAPCYTCRGRIERSSITTGWHPTKAQHFPFKLHPCPP